MATNIRKIICMMSRIFLFSFIITTFCFGQETSTDNQNQLKVMTFNIRYGKAEDGVNKWENRKQLLFDVIKTFNPDVFGMQEALKFQIDEIIGQLQNYYFVGVGRDDGKEQGEFSPILFSKERFTADTTETFWLSDTPTIPGSKNWGNGITRICSWVKLTDKITNKSFYFFNTHVDHMSAESRVKSAQAIVAKIQQMSELLPVIVTGDFNTGEDDETIKTIKASGLIDTYRILHPKSNEEGTFHNFTGDDNGVKIDFIFVSRDFQILQSMIDKTNKDDHYPSDHFPVQAVLQFVR
jgi:endonuclease/exonuclease/phosphatase family metal-dependent hydrolase